MMLGFCWILYLILFFFYIYIPQSEQAYVVPLLQGIFFAELSLHLGKITGTQRVAMVTTAIYSINFLVWPIPHI